MVNDDWLLNLFFAACGIDVRCRVWYVVQQSAQPTGQDSQVLMFIVSAVCGIRMVCGLRKLEVSFARVS